MRLTIRSGSPTTEACDALIVLAAEDKGLSGPAAAVDAAAHGALAAVLALGDFDGKANSTRLVHVGDGLRAQRVLLVGTGDGGGDSAASGRLAGGAAIQGVSGMTIRTAVVVLPERADPTFVQGTHRGADARFLPVRSPSDCRGNGDRGGFGHAAGRHGR